MTRYNRRWLQNKQRNSAGSQSSASRRLAYHFNSDVHSTESTKWEQLGLTLTKEIKMNTPPFVVKNPNNYVFEEGEWWYCGFSDPNQRQRAGSHHKKNTTRMFVNGRYIPKSHP